MKKEKIITSIILGIIIVLPVLVHAQPPDPGGDVNAPLDGGLSLLIAGGVGYGIKKIRDKKSSNK
ncbi:MAG: hypothetical protein KGO81_10130 [Bacteroidota bacterium]|nr:hypothetical protein [Bacteroidota bacterium]